MLRWFASKSTLKVSLLMKAPRSENAFNRLYVNTFSF